MKVFHIPFVNNETLRRVDAGRKIARAATYLDDSTRRKNDCLHKWLQYEFDDKPWVLTVARNYLLFPDFVGTALASSKESLGCG
jgi:hypothetical protein